MNALLYLLLFIGAFFPGISYFKYDSLIIQWFICLFITITIVLYEILIYKESNLKRITILIGKIASISILFECIFAIIQAFYHNCDVKGTMNNTTGLALNIVLLLPFVLENTGTIIQKEKYLYTSAITIATATIILTGCRTAIICLIVILIIYITKNNKILKSPKYIVITIITTISIFSFILSHKYDSTTGRWFILKNSTELIIDSPICGYIRKGKFVKVYMEKQKEYFKKNKEDCNYSMLADDIRHPLNEFIYAWINYGIFGCLLLITLLIFPFFIFCKNKDFCGICTMCALIISCTFSYPLQYPLPVIALLLCNIISILSIIKKTSYIALNKNVIIISTFLFLIIQGYIGYNFYYYYNWKKIAYIALKGYNKNTLYKYEKLYTHFRNDIFFLYNYMSELYYAGRFEEAINISKELQKKFSSYNLELLLGDTYMQLKRDKEAIEHYENAMYMCPCRFAPLEGLYNIYSQNGDSIKKEQIVNNISQKEIKVFSGDIKRIKEICK